MTLRPPTSVGRAHMRERLRFVEEVPAPAVRTPSYNLVRLRHFQSMSEKELIAIGESKLLRKDFFLKMGQKGYSVAEMKQAESRLTMALERVEAALDDGRPWLPDKYSLADICIIPVLMRLEDLGMNYLWDEFDYVAE